MPPVSAHWSATWPAASWAASERPKRLAAEPCCQQPGLQPPVPAFIPFSEIQNRRRTGGVLAWESFGRLLRLLLGALLATVALRFNINYETKKYRAGSEKIPLLTVKCGF